MASPRKRTREELIANGYCPICSKCTSDAYGFDCQLDGCIPYGCRKCGTRLLEVSRFNNHVGLFVEVTGEWLEVIKWYEQRRREIEAKVDELEVQLSEDLRRTITPMLKDADPSTDSSRRGLALVRNLRPIS